VGGLRPPFFPNAQFRDIVNVSIQGCIVVHVPPRFTQANPPKTGVSIWCKSDTAYPLLNSELNLIPLKKISSRHFHFQAKIEQT